MRSFMMMIMLLACGLHADAAEVVMEATEHAGTISFDRLTNAPGTQVTGYRVEWMNDSQGTWQPFGLAELDYIPAEGSSPVTASVPGFYRVSAKQLNYLVVDMTGGWDAGAWAGTNLFPMSILSDVPPGGWTDTHKTTHMVFRLVPAGTYMRGSPAGELGRYADETQHEVTITRPFYIGIFPVTQKQWELMSPLESDKWPSYFSNVTYRETRPVEQVSYRKIRGESYGEGWPYVHSVQQDFLTFILAMRKRIGRDVDIPTEAQWEYAARAGTTTALNSGYDLTDVEEDPRMDEVGRYYYNSGDTWDPEGDTSEGTAAVGSYLPNAWGLYDMHGNVWEWCLDWYGEYPANAVTDPRGPGTGPGRVIRGGSYRYLAGDTRSAIREYVPPTDDLSDIGFRLVIPLPD